MVRTIRARDVKAGDRLTGVLGGALTVREAVTVDPTRTEIRVTDTHGNNFGYSIHPERWVDLELPNATA